MHVVICGYSRSGSTLLHALLRENVTNYHCHDAEQSALDCLGRHPRQVSKRPLDVFCAEAIADRGANVRFVVLLRDLRSILTSCHWRWPGFCVDWDRQGDLPRAGAAAGENVYPGVVPTYEAIARLADPLFVRFEDLLRQPDVVQDRLRGELGFEYRGRFRDWATNDRPPPARLRRPLNGYRRLDPAAAARWRRFPLRLREQFGACPRLFDILVEYGYEPDRRWFSELPDQTLRAPRSEAARCELEYARLLRFLPAQVHSVLDIGGSGGAGVMVSRHHGGPVIHLAEVAGEAGCARSTRALLRDSGVARVVEHGAAPETLRCDLVLALQRPRDDQLDRIRRILRAGGRAIVDVADAPRAQRRLEEAGFAVDLVDAADLGGPVESTRRVCLRRPG